jgi:exodeoxyribonuclease V alpha subunit
MRRLLEAVPPSARVVLLGDRHQLASVEAGSVLADICGTGPHPGYSSELCKKALEVGGPGLRERKKSAPAIVDSVVELTKSHRFDEKSGIAAFARAVNAGDGARARSIALGEHADLVLGGATDEGEVFAQLSRRALPALSRVVAAKSPADALSQLEEFRVLCAHRRGPLGVTRVNERLEAALEKSGVLNLDGPHYLGRPVMVLKNDHALGLFNGDIGVIGLDENGARRAFFRDGQGGLRELSVLRLPPHETAFAMSIHKSQGSEFAEVTIVLPEPDSPLLTRELLYTAVTRARKRATLLGDARCLELGAARPVSRASGLEALLHE